MTKQQQYPIIIQAWEESERGWGSRPDGYSIHLTTEDKDKFIKEFWDRQPDDYVPDEYSRPCGQPTVKMVSKKLYTKIQKDIQDKHGMRLWDLKVLDGSNC